MSYPLTKAGLVAFNRCWGLWRRWLRYGKRWQGGRVSREQVHWLWRQIRAEHLDT